MKTIIKSFGQAPGEIGQSTKARMALCRVDNGVATNCHEIIKCKDFMHDAMACMFIKGRKSDIWGFRYDPETMPKIPTTGLTVYVTGVSEEDVKNSVSVLKALSGGDKGLKVSMETTDGGFLVMGGVEWCLSPAAISLFTGMIRAGQYGGCDGTVDGLRKHFKKMATMHGNDPSYIKQAGAENAVGKMQKLLADKKIQWDQMNYGTLPPHTLHHGCGWVSYCAGMYAEASGDGAFPVN